MSLAPQTCHQRTRNLKLCEVLRVEHSELSFFCGGSCGLGNIFLLFSILVDEGADRRLRKLIYDISKLRLVRKAVFLHAFIKQFGRSHVEPHSVDDVVRVQGRFFLCHILVFRRMCRFNP